MVGEILQQEWLNHPEDDEWDGGKRAVRHGWRMYTTGIWIAFSIMPQLLDAMRSAVEEMRRVCRASKRRDGIILSFWERDANSMSVGPSAGSLGSGLAYMVYFFS